MRQVVVTTTVREEHVITQQDIINALRTRGINVPDKADVIVRVPTGDEIGIDDAPVLVKFTETNTKYE